MANIPRLYLSKPLAVGQSVSIDEAQAKYLIRVMRLAQGAKVRAFDGQNGEWMCQLQIYGKRAELQPIEQLRPQVPVLDLTLLFAPLKKTRTDFVVEKASELGVRNICPVITEFTQTGRVRVDRLQMLAVEAAEQTERMDVPVIDGTKTLIRALHDWDVSVPMYFCDESGDGKSMIDTLSTAASNSAGILIGPEGGFSKNERDLLNKLDFVIPIALGPRILRAETAVVSALTLWQSVVGDWQQAPYLPQK